MRFDLFTIALIVLTGLEGRREDCVSRSVFSIAVAPGEGGRADDAAVILVDMLRKYPSGYWCHMVSDSSLQELHNFACRLGLCRERFQEHGRLPHYDLRPETRETALALGAEAVSSKELFKRGREAFLRVQER
jgi:hypothetical protein